MNPQLLAVCIAFSLFGIFLIQFKVQKRALSARVLKQGKSPLLGHLPMEFAYWVLAPFEKTAVRLNLSPNVFSWSCFALGLIAGILIAFGEFTSAGLVSIVSALFDSLDGMVARARGVSSDAGEVLDAAVDRYTEFFFLAGAIIYYRFSVELQSLALFALLGSFMVSYSQAKADTLNTAVPKGWMRRPERAAYLSASSFLAALVPLTNETQNATYPIFIAALVLVGVLSNLAALQRFVVLYKAHKKK